MAFSIRRLLSTALVVAGFLPLILFSALFWSILRTHLDRDIRETSKAALQTIILQTTTQILESSRQLLPQLLMNAEASSDVLELRSQLRAAITPRPEYKYLAFLDSNRRIEAAYPDDAATIGIRYDLRANAVDGNVSFSSPFRPALSVGSVMEVSYPSEGRSVVGYIDVARLSSKLFLFVLSPEDLIGVTDAAGRYIMCSEPSRVERGESVPLSVFDDELRTVKLDSGEFYVSAISIPGSEWFAVYFRSRPVAEAPILSYLALVLTLSVIGVLLSAVFSYLVWRKVSIPLSVLTSRIELVTAGQYSERISGSFAMEFQEIADGFNEMAESIERRHTEINQLLHEVYHRVKNNQQLVVSLLRMQADSEVNPQVKKPLIHAQDRMYAMALANELVYQTEDFSSINLASLMDQLISNLMLNAELRRSALELSVEDAELDFNKAVPIALMVNELVSDILNGFNDDGISAVRVDARMERVSLGDDILVLILERTGQGTPDNGTPESGTPESGTGEPLGRIIAQALAAQLNGDARWSSPEGPVCVRIDVRIPMAMGKASSLPKAR